MHALSEEALTGNSRFVGFNVDLIEQLHLRMKFEYKIQLVEDGTHDGMIADVLNKVMCTSFLAHKTSFSTYIF